MATSVLTVEQQIRRATKYDVLDGSKLKTGLTYYLKSVLKKDMFCGPLKTADYTNRKEFSQWYKEGRIFIPVSALDNNVRVSEI